MLSEGNSITQIVSHALPVLTALPERLGRYKILRELGRGAFGRVLLADDEWLKRRVALKLLRLSGAAAAMQAKFLAEAQIIAKMDHPGIVPIFDATEHEDGVFCIVSQYVEGQTLRDELRDRGFAYEATARIILRVCEALYHAHGMGVVHRDVKPANIMLKGDESPVLLDFGLAKSLQDGADIGLVAGTPGYMSPEQARGEDHLVSGRSDIFSLGVVFYEMLTASRAYSVSSADEHLARVAAGGPRPPREVIATVPKELARICTKAMHPQLRWRYADVEEMTADLRLWLSLSMDNEVAEPGATQVPLSDVDTALLKKVRVVPRGLRAFDEGDSAFFLNLIPGPRDQFGLPESLRFWKQRIESKEAHLAFRVGVLYGPSGCGKSSLLGAGLLPRCSDHVKVLHHEARDTGNAARMARTLVAMFPELEGAEASPAAFIYRMRTSGVLLATQKLLLVIDQTEQWLRACEDPESAEGTALLNTLRQCDGIHVQALLLVRDDFWRGVSRLMADADVDLVGNNSALVDLFEPRHAEMVLESFGRAYQCLPEDPLTPLPEASSEFIRHSVQSLAEGGKISPVRLALFTEMFRSRTWTVESLRDVGGASGVAVAFLEDVFCGAAARGPRRVHEAAARNLLQKLVPVAGEVRGPAQSQRALLEASGYEDKPQAFAELVQVLDADLRLLTPVDPDETADGLPAWQLTHDHMVPALRQWLLAKKADTLRGRAEIALAERSHEWARHPAATRVPHFWEWLRLRLLTRPKRWSKTEAEWMQAGMRRARTSALCIAVLAAIVAWGALESRNAMKGQLLAEQLLVAPSDEVATKLKEQADWRIWAMPHLQQAIAKPVTTLAGLNARLALVAAQPEHAEPLARTMLSADARTFGAIRDALAEVPRPVSAAIFQQVLNDPKAIQGSKLRAVAGLATCCKMETISGLILEEAVQWLLHSVSEVSPWAKHLRPLAPKLSPTLAGVLTTASDEAQRLKAAMALVSLHGDDPATLVRLLSTFPPSMIQLIVAELRSQSEAIKLLDAALLAAKPLVESSNPLTPEEEAAYVARCNMMLASLCLGSGEKVWPELARDADRTLRSFLFLNAASTGVPPEMVIDRLLQEQDAGIRYALLLALAQYPFSTLQATSQQTIITTLRRAFLADPDSGIHSAIITLMRRWAMDDELKTLTESLPRTPLPARGMGWWVTPSGLDMRVIRMSSGRRFGIAACEVSRSDYMEFQPIPKEAWFPNLPGNAPATGMVWKDAARHCMLLTTKEGNGPGVQFYAEAGDEIVPFAEPLHRQGYRLPTEVEWKVATSNATISCWDFGNAESHLPMFSWTAINAGDFPRPTATRLPNDQGLWDTLGNVQEWTQNRGPMLMNITVSAQMGESYASIKGSLNSKYVNRVHIGYGRKEAGFRIARSLP